MSIKRLSGAGLTTPKSARLWDQTTLLSGMYSLATVEVPSGGTSAITFSGIPTDYTHLRIHMFVQTNKATYGRDSFKFRFNSDSGSNYSSHQVYSEGSTPAGGGLASQTSIYFDAISTGVATNVFGVAIVDIANYASTTKSKTIKGISGIDHNGAIAGYYGMANYGSGGWYKNSAGVYEAINTIEVTPWSGTAWNQYSHVALYGIKVA